MLTGKTVKVPLSLPLFSLSIMVRTKKQIIDSLAIKNNKQDDANTTRLGMIDL